jgi:sugar/nucleoside kinase (ribokinase family)
VNRLLVIGGASLDGVSLRDQTSDSVSGAGTYIAMAARRCGAQVAMLSPIMLPTDLSKHDLVHVTRESDVSTQLSLIRACRQRGAPQISAGMDPGDAVGQPQAIHALMEQSDYFFVSDLQAEAVFGFLEVARTEPGRVVFATLGALGACIIQGNTSTSIQPIRAAELDPAGTGGAFCGATLAFLLQKQHPIMAAHRALALAAEMTGQVGPAVLLPDDPPPEAHRDPRVRVNDDQVRQVARVIYSLSTVSPYPFVDPALPPVGHPKTVDYFFAATLQQFSFWWARDNRYHQPLIARIGSVERKGSDYLWAAFTRRLEEDAEFCSPERQANLSRKELLAAFRSDDGQDPMPALDLHLEQARAYGRDMLALRRTPQAVLDKALASAQPLQTFLVTLDDVGGYKEDPMRKKSLLLAMILNDRPETFLPLRDDEQIAPIMDYHFMRSCLRIGLIDVLDGELEAKLINRQLVSPADEWAVRYPAYLAIEQLVTLSGRTMGAVNNLLFTNARKRCPEMTEPECQSCDLDPVCAHRKEFFQPVLRTTFY